jgi:hypothetical protein
VLDYPYVTASEFRAHPTFLDSNNLRTGGTQVDQDAALTNILLEASQWADDKVNMPLGAHVRTENVRLTASRSGQLRYHPEHAPVISVTSMSVGATPDELDEVADPQVWTERDGRIIVAFSPSGGPGLSSLQFGWSAAAGEQLVSWTYIAGYPSTQLTAAASTGATTLTVRDTTGISAGTVLRLWTPGLEEAVTVASVAGTTLTLTGGLTNTHPAAGTCSALPTTARQAVINYATMLLMRPASTAESYAPNARGPATTSTTGDSRRTGRATFLYDDACKLLKPFKRVR